MNRDKFEYFLNAVHYCLWLNEKKRGHFISKIMDTILSPIPKFFFTKKRKERFYKNIKDNQQQFDELFYGKNASFSIGWAHHWFGYFYSCYSAFIAFIVVGIANRLLGKLDMFLFLLFFGIPIGILYIPAYRAVFSGDKYLKYFKEFEKKDDQWHKKWKRITIAFCVGSIISAVAGFFCMAIITSI